MLDAELTAAEYKDIRNTLAPEIDLLDRKKVALLTSEDDYQQYLDKGIPMLQNIDKHWLAADLNGKQHIVGSIFPQKLVFEKNSYRTIGENPVLALIAATGAGFGVSQKRKGQHFADLSTWVPRNGFEPSHLTAPPPEDGASTNFATWAIALGTKGCEDIVAHHSGQKTLLPYAVIRLHPRNAALSIRPNTSKLPAPCTVPTSSVAMKAQE